MRQVEERRGAVRVGAVGPAWPAPGPAGPTLIGSAPPAIIALTSNQVGVDYGEECHP